MNYDFDVNVDVTDVMILDDGDSNEYDDNSNDYDERDNEKK